MYNATKTYFETLVEVLISELTPTNYSETMGWVQNNIDKIFALDRNALYAELYDHDWQKYVDDQIKKDSKFKALKDCFYPTKKDNEFNIGELNNHEQNIFARMTKYLAYNGKWQERQVEDLRLRLSTMYYFAKQEVRVFIDLVNGGYGSYIDQRGRDTTGSEIESYYGNGSYAIAWELKRFFQPSFVKRKGSGTDSNSLFYDRLIPDLRDKMNNKEFAALALMIYNSNVAEPRVKRMSFASWYSKFCELTGREYHKGYKPNNLQNKLTEISDKYGYIK